MVKISFQSLLVITRWLAIFTYQGNLEKKYSLYYFCLLHRLNVKGNDGTGVFNSTQHFLTRMK